VPRRVVTGEESGHTSGLGSDETRHGEVVGAEGAREGRRRSAKVSGGVAPQRGRSRGRPWPERRPPESFANKILFLIAFSLLTEVSIVYF